MSDTVAEAARLPCEWSDGELTAPESGRLLRADSPHSCTDGVARYPVVDGIPFLRTGREALRSAALTALDAGDGNSALSLLLADRDDWARGDGPREEEIWMLIRTGPDSTLREAMRLLAYGPVADYFAYRWSDPTYLSGLKLLEIGLAAGTKHVVEIACGIGHYLRELTERGLAATGVDVVFSKLWLAKKFVAPRARLVCADVSAGLPFEDCFADTIFCHDAFYFLPEKKKVAHEILRVASGPVLIGHAHNREAENFSSGEPWSVEEYAALLPGAVVYDDAELTRAFLEDRDPAPLQTEEHKPAPAISFISRAGGGARFADGLSRDFAKARMSAPLFPNPLLIGKDGAMLSQPAWPSERYAQEYGLLSGYLYTAPGELSEETIKDAENFTSRVSVRLHDFVRRRIFLQLPARW